MRRTFSREEVTSGVSYGSRKEDERQEVRRLRDLRGRVKAARAVVSNTPGLAETLVSDWRKAARFCARFGVMDEMFWHGLLADAVARERPADALRQSMNALVEVAPQSRTVS